MCIGINVKKQLILSYIKWKLNFLGRFSNTSVQWLPSCSMPKKRVTNGQTRRHDEAKSRSSQFCERILKCDSLSETIWLTKTPLNLCSLVIVLFKQEPLRVSSDWLVQLRIITTLQGAAMQLVEPLIQCFNGRKACSSSNWNEIRWQSKTEALYSVQYPFISAGEVTSSTIAYKRPHRQENCKIT
jgi:hypothetical protein